MSTAGCLKGSAIGGLKLVQMVVLKECKWRS